MTGLKYDQGKPPMELLDPLALEGLARVLEFGKNKYTKDGKTGAHNWRGGISYGRLIGALLRHTMAILRGEDIDPESGLPHVDHVGCCWLFLSNMMKTRPDMDDRWKDGKDKQRTDPEQLRRAGYELETALRNTDVRSNGASWRDGGTVQPRVEEHQGWGSPKSGPAA